MGQQKRETFSKSERKWDFEYFCRVGMISGLRQKLELSENVFVELKWDFE